MAKRSNYERTLRAVRDVIHRWDPYRLLGGGCPSDEFDREVTAVAAQISRIRSVTDATYVLSRVFGSSFESERFRPADCSAAGADLYEALSSEGLLAE
jgi:hypothetical protein